MSISSEPSASAIATTRHLARSRCAPAQAATRLLEVLPSNVTRIARGTFPGSPTRSPFQACLCRTTSTSRGGCRSAPAGVSTITVNTERSSARVCRRLCGPVRGRADGPLSYTFTLFGSRVRHPIDVDRSDGLVLTNRSEPTTNVGVELLGTMRRAPYALTVTYTYVQARELDGASRRDAPLTPRHGAGVVGMWEREDVGRVGVEFYYTGVQRLEQNPFSERSRPYTIIGALAERQFGRIRLFINGENLTGVRQTRSDPLVRPRQAPDGRWTVDAWSPLEGRNINGGFRVRF